MVELRQALGEVSGKEAWAGSGGSRGRPHRAPALWGEESAVLGEDRRGRSKEEQGWFRDDGVGFYHYGKGMADEVGGKGAASRSVGAEGP